MPLLYIAAVILAIALPPYTVGAQLDPANLKDIKSVSVILDLNAKDVDDNFDESALRTAIELRCRQNGLTVVSPSDTTTAPDAFITYEALAMWNMDKTQRIHYSRLYLDAIARTTRLSSPRAVFGTLWSSGGSIGYAGRDHAFSKVLREAAEQATDKFLNTYLSVNPKK
jgi:hypothetical protein